MGRSLWRCCAFAWVLMLCVAPAVFAVAGEPAQEPGAGQEGEPPMSPEEAAMMVAFEESMTPGPEHEALAKSVGEYDMKVTMWQAPDAEPETVTGTATRSMIFGGRVLQEKVESEVMGMAFEGEGRTGFDNVTGAFWSTWNDNMSTGLYSSTGKRREDGCLEFRGQGPDPMAGGMVQQKSVVHFNGDGSERHEMWEERDGEWVKTMEIVYTRK